MRSIPRLLPLVLCSLVISAPTRAAEGDPAKWRTRAERTAFRETSGYDETLDYLRRLEETWPAISLQQYGVSPQGRGLPLVVVSQGRAFSPEAAAASGKALVLIQNGIHAGEIDGKDASLMLLRDMALGRHRKILEHVILLVIPIYNVDGHERVSIYNRANQNGPVAGTGFRTTADGRDLNRDHLKLATTEGRRVVELFGRWRPHLHVDDHVTDGSEHDWVLTYSWAEAPRLPEPLDAWLVEHMPRVVAATEEAGHAVGPYVSLLDGNDPGKGFSSIVGEPRYATGYYPLRNVPSILVENHAYKPYEARVLANRDFLLALLREVASGRDSLIAAVRRSRARTTALGAPGAPPSDVVLRWRPAEATEQVEFPVYDWYLQDSRALGVPIVRYRRGEIRETEVPWVHRVEPELKVPRPRGYLVLPGWPAIEQRLAGHGLRFRRLESPVDLEVETLRLSAPRTVDDAVSYQGLTRIAFDVARRQERREFPAGTLWIPAAQPDFEVAVQLLEPEAPDSLVAWGLLSTIFERKEYIDARSLEDLVREMLRDETTAAEWRAAAEDETLASDPRARWLWWYRRTPYWDETVGLMPVMRLLHGSPPARQP